EAQAAFESAASLDPSGPYRWELVRIARLKAESLLEKWPRFRLGEALQVANPAATAQWCATVLWSAAPAAAAGAPMLMPQPLLLGAAVGVPHTAPHAVARARANFAEIGRLLEQLPPDHPLTTDARGDLAASHVKLANRLATAGSPAAAVAAAKTGQHLLPASCSAAFPWEDYLDLVPNLVARAVMPDLAENL